MIVLMKITICVHAHAFDIQHDIQILCRLGWLIVVVARIGSPSHEVEFWGLVVNGGLT